MGVSGSDRQKPHMHATREKGKDNPNQEKSNNNIWADRTIRPRQYNTEEKNRTRRTQKTTHTCSATRTSCSAPKRET